LFARGRPVPVGVRRELASSCPACPELVEGSKALLLHVPRRGALCYLLMAGHRIFSSGPFKRHERVVCPEQVRPGDIAERVERALENSFYLLVAGQIPVAAWHESRHRRDRVVPPALSVSKGAKRQLHKRHVEGHSSAGTGFALCRV